jgi:hypothetical protein
MAKPLAEQRDLPDVVRLMLDQEGQGAQGRRISGREDMPRRTREKLR